MPRNASVRWSIGVERNGQRLATRARMAHSFVRRLVGLLDQNTLEAGGALIITACQSIHTCFMRFPIDVVFVDSSWRVVAMWHALPPWRVTPLVARARIVVELPAGTAHAAHLTVGDTLTVEPVALQEGLDIRGVVR